MTFSNRYLSYIFTPPLTPGTRVREEKDRYEIKILTDDWSEYHANRAVVETPFVKKKRLDEIIVDWEAKFDEWLGKIKARRETGEADEKEAWPLSRLEHTVLIYEMMMKNILEKRGSWPVEKGSLLKKDDLLKTLEKKIRPHVDAKDDQLQKTLEFATDLGCLEFCRENGFVKWKWGEQEHSAEKQKN